MFRCYRDNENLKKAFWPYGHFKNGEHLQEVPNVYQSINQIYLGHCVHGIEDILSIRGRGSCIKRLTEIKETKLNK